MSRAARTALQAVAGVALVSVVLWPRTWPLAACVVVGCAALDHAIARSVRA